MGLRWADDKFIDCNHIGASLIVTEICMLAVQCLVQAMKRL